MTQNSVSPQIGEHWRWSIEGKVMGITMLEPSARIDGMFDYISVDRGTWERLPDPEPEYIAGEIYRDFHAVHWLRVADGTHPWRMVDGGWALYLETTPRRPLVRLVPEVKS